MSWLDGPDYDPYKEYLMEETKRASNDRECGLLGMSQAANEYKKLRRELGYNNEED